MSENANTKRAPLWVTSILTIAGGVALTLVAVLVCLLLVLACSLVWKAIEGVLAS